MTCRARRWRRIVTIAVASLGLTQGMALASDTFFRPVTLGEPQQAGGFSIRAEMYPGVPIAGMHDPAADLPETNGEEYIHLACHIRTGRQNPYGMRPGDWMPSLRVRFTLTNQETGQSVEGDLYGLVDKAGPHYGMNLHMLGAGDYMLVLFTKPPHAKNLARVTGEYAGVPEWFTPFNTTIEFTYDPEDVFPDK